MTRIGSVLFALTVLMVSVSAGADVSGRWKVSYKANWTSIPDMACTLSQKDQKLEGTCEAADGRDGKGVDLNDGRVEGDRLSWTWTIVVPDGVAWTYAFAGTVDANGTTMKGVVTLSAGPGAKPNEASFAATKE